MAGRDIIVIGASAGGVEALKLLAGLLPADLPAAVFVVLHLPPKGRSVLPQILARSGPLPATHPRDGEVIERGRIYVAPPDVHMLLQRGSIRLEHGPRENSHRPAIDPLFRTAAAVYGPRVAGVVLSGLLDDGAAGLVAIRQRGGTTLVQDPEEALYPGMPRNALETRCVDHSLPIAELAATLDRLAREPVAEEPDPPVPATLDLEALQNAERPGTPSGFACPDCGGVLWELQEGETIRFRCRVGHAWSPLSLIARQSDALEEALWTALRALEERATFAGRLTERMIQRGIVRSADYFASRARESREHALMIRAALLSESRESEEFPTPDPAPGAALDPAGGATTG